jgi:hypothetical protein
MSVAGSMAATSTASQAQPRPTASAKETISGAGTRAPASRPEARLSGSAARLADGDGMAGGCLAGVSSEPDLSP